MQHIDSVILAAGMSTRMGRWKMMMPFGDGTILDAAINNALGFCHRVIVVSGFRGDELAQHYHKHPGVVVVHNADYPQGMLSSIRVGVQQVRGSHFFLALGDMPCINSWVYAALWQERGAFTLIPRCSLGKGHPVLLPSTLIPHIQAAGPDMTMKQVIQRQDYRFLEVKDFAIHQDVDTPQQYQQLCHRDAEQAGECPAV
ncbi:molybdenum cofactor cytidylyltransferase [Serratia fonticola]|uniref:Molybdenum cofactor cytidylyltransferase n=1 Tax=Serratia fonticola TaxID=47917 RepID=A0A559T283_SERFO|nr:molybdenum cofactor cytidylyltransferase [Serratia fonticola]TQI99185.1 molybdenum cofactor cytidylyltransferase [Serratia fonticola]TVZ68710.1 molybdenum cofactor cytidylyltransferase [Serratia fonticola]